MIEEVCSLSLGCPVRRTWTVFIGQDLFGEHFVRTEYGPSKNGKTTERTYALMGGECPKRTAGRLIKGAKRRGYYANY